MSKEHKMLSEEAGPKKPNRAEAAKTVRLASEIGARTAAAEALRIEEVKARGAVPEVCGPDIPVAPARGPLRVFRPIELVPGSVGTARDTGHWARGEEKRRRGARREDVFDRMDDLARAAHRARGEDAGPFVPPLSPGQVQIGRDYRDLTERHMAGGMRCASLETAGRRQGGGGGEFIDAFVAEGRRLDALVRRIGVGVSMEIRRQRPSKRGSRVAIRDRSIVDMICLSDMDPSAVLRSHGWAVKGETREALRRSLAAALDRMQGYDRA